MILDTIRNWIIGVLNKMITKTNVREALGIDVSVSSAMLEKLQLWSSMYENKAPWLSDQVFSLNLPSAIANEIARSVTLELKVEISGERGKYLFSQLEPYLPSLRHYVEYGVAKGGLIMKPWVSGDQILVDFVQADRFFPVSFDSNGNITDCVFSEQRIKGKKFYTRLEMHSMVEGGCTILNKAYVSESSEELGREVPLDTLDIWADLEPEATIKDISKPLFSYFKYPLANTVDPLSPLGISCYSRAEDLIKQADQIWSNMLWEFESGQRALYVDVLAFGKDKNGKPILPSKRLYKTIESGSPEGEFFEAWSPEFREASILSGLEATLKKIEFVTGLTYGTLSDPQSVEKTATEIVSSRQRSYSTIVDTQKSLQSSLEGLIEAMDIWATIANLAPKGTYQTTFDFDDSVVVDKQAQMANDLLLVTSGIMSKLEFRMRNFKEDEETAKEKLGLIQEEQPENPDMSEGENQND